MITPWNNLPKNITLGPSVNSFKNRLVFYLKRVSRSIHIYSYRTAIGEADGPIASRDA